MNFETGTGPGKGRERESLSSLHLRAPLADGMRSYQVLAEFSKLAPTESAAPMDSGASARFGDLAKWLPREPEPEMPVKPDRLSALPPPIEPHALDVKGIVLPVTDSPKEYPRAIYQIREISPGSGEDVHVGEITRGVPELHGSLVRRVSQDVQALSGLDPLALNLNVKAPKPETSYPLVNFRDLRAAIRAVQENSVSSESSIAEALEPFVQGRLRIEPGDSQIDMFPPATSVLDLELADGSLDSSGHLGVSRASYQVLDPQLLDPQLLGRSPEDRSIDKLSIGTLQVSHGHPTYGDDSILEMGVEAEVPSGLSGAVPPESGLESDVRGRISVAWQATRDLAASLVTLEESPPSGTDIPDQTDSAVYAVRGAVIEDSPRLAEGGSGAGRAGGGAGEAGGGGRGGEGPNGGEEWSEGDPEDSAQRLRLALAARQLEDLAVRRWGQQWGPNFGLVKEPLAEIAVSAALPVESPPDNFVRSASETYEVNSPTMRRANLWAAALDAFLLDNPESLPNVEAETAIGFAAVGGEVRLSVIHYVDPEAFAVLPVPESVVVANRSFPTVYRPRLSMEHGGLMSAPVRDGHCWVSSSGQVALLTANHAIPASLHEGEIVTPATSRNPPLGVLRCRSGIMDAALLDLVDASGSEARETVAISSRIGFKPVRLISGRRVIDAEVREIPFLRGVIPVNPGNEPAMQARLRMSKHLSPGDSGCLVLDTEFEAFGGQALPYLMYLAMDVLGPERSDRLGAGVLLEQIRATWNLEFLSTATT